MTGPTNQRLGVMRPRRRLAVSGSEPQTQRRHYTAFIMRELIDSLGYPAPLNARQPMPFCPPVKASVLPEGSPAFPLASLDT
jgi:hypothetical protein